MTRIGDRPRPFELASSSELREQERVQTLPHARLLPLIEPPIAGRARAKPELERQVPPGDPCVQYEEDPLQRLPVGQALAARIAKAAFLLGQERLDSLPQLVRHGSRRDR